MKNLIEFSKRISEHDLPLLRGRGFYGPFQVGDRMGHVLVYEGEGHFACKVVLEREQEQFLSEYELVGEPKEIINKFKKRQ